MHLILKKQSTLIFFFLLCTLGFSQKYEEINSKNIESIFMNQSNLGIQYGSSNQLEAVINNQNLKIEQFGNANNFLFLDSSYVSSNTSQLHVQTLGNQNTIQIFGSNSISENMSFSQFSNQKSITIINR